MAQEEDGGTGHGAHAAAACAAADGARIEAYEPPALIVLGTVAELTRGTSSTAVTDGTFPGSLFA